MASARNGPIYLGVASNLPARAYQHRRGLIDGFTRRYGCKLLVWFEAHDGIQNARLRERQLKKWNRRWKLRLIEECNPMWRDLYGTIAAG